MASFSRRLHNSRSRRSNRTTGHPTGPVQLVDVDQLENTCIDLTADTHNDDVIDLTSSNSIIESPVVRLTPADNVGPVRRRGSGRRGTRRSLTPRTNVTPPDVHVLHSDESNDELPDVPFYLSRDAVAANESLLKSPQGVKISCPICLDDISQIQRSHRQVISTICGHIFCNVCIKAAIASQSVCPSCRKRLTIRNIHPLFL